MKISANFSALGKTKWYEYAVRFVLGGVVTIIAGLLAKRFWPGIRRPISCVSSDISCQRHTPGKTRTRKETTRGDYRSGARSPGCGPRCGRRCNWRHRAYMLCSGHLEIAAVECWMGVSPLAIMAWLSVSFSLWWIRKKHWLSFSVEPRASVNS